MREYEIWWAELPEPAGQLPVLLLSREDAYGYLSKFIAAEITFTIRQIASEIPFGEGEGLPEFCVANCDLAPRSGFRPRGQQGRHWGGGN